MLHIVCFGEVLWDVFPTHKKIGGAPLNVAIRLKSYHNKVAMVSAVGNDELGSLILKYLEETGIQSDQVQVLDNFTTGEVAVKLNAKGSASYDIIYPKAWDKIAGTSDVKSLVETSNAFVFGSLIARDEVSKTTLDQLLEVAKYKIFDVNLRPPFYSKELLIELMNKADFIKFNDEELYLVAEYLGSKYHNLEQNIHFILEKTNTKDICVTKGEHGAVLFYNNQLYYNSGYKIEVADTVGSGDSFLASLIYKLLSGVPPQESIDFSCAVGALVASKSGANPMISNEEIERFINP
ncbi:carbohydrate kinase [Polaribacter litorisediminis]|uniref:carbohydrate kinase family protein n=1 Tax=Polaribacter litorisediminis TaxID=1908341 RepID=UPI001CC1B0A2|nr:carbohydrate kinase [Polaribacter litorisediminis]UAM98599.1 carbohydrate kinase [Polaribacter litorisediminis]